MIFPDALEQTLAALLAEREDPRSALVPSLRAVQRYLGWISDECLAEIAARTGVELEDAGNISSYFDLARTPPEARHVIEICVNVSCAMRGSEALVARCRERLGIAPGEVTADGAFALAEVLCLKACETGPSIRLNRELREGITREDLDALLTQLGAPG